MDLRAVALALLVAFVVGLSLPWQVGPLQPATDPAATIESFEVTDAGCRDSVRDVVHSRNGPDGRYVFENVVHTESPNATLSAWVQPTAPGGPGVRVASYRVDVVSDSPADDTCDGAVAYRLVVDASDAAHATQMAVYVNNHAVSCSGTAAGEVRTTCDELLGEEPDRHSATA